MDEEKVDIYNNFNKQAKTKLLIFFNDILKQKQLADAKQ